MLRGTVAGMWINFSYTDINSCDLSALKRRVDNKKERKMKLLGKNNDLYKDGKITKNGYIVLMVSSILGLGCFLIGRSLYAKAIQHANK